MGRGWLGCLYQLPHYGALTSSLREKGVEGYPLVLGRQPTQGPACWEPSFVYSFCFDRLPLHKNVTRQRSIQLVDEMPAGSERNG